MRGFACMASVSALALAMAGTASAGDFDGSKTLICVATDMLSCQGAGDCRRATAEDLDIPQFINVDVAGKMISGKLYGGGERKTPIQTVSTAGGRSVLQGSENGRGWSMVITHENGHMSGAIAGAKVAFVLLGACTPR